MSNHEFDGPRGAAEEQLFWDAYWAAHGKLQGDDAVALNPTTVMPTQPGAPDGVLYADRLRAGRRKTARRILGGIACATLATGMVAFSDEARTIAHDLAENATQFAYEQLAEEGDA